MRLLMYRIIPTLFLPMCLLLLPSPRCEALDVGMAKQVLAEMNLARENPRRYAEHLKAFRARFRGNSYLLPGSTTTVATSEGTRGVDEAIRFISRQKPLPPLSWSDGLAEAA